MGRKPQRNLHRTADAEFWVEGEREGEGGGRVTLKLLLNRKTKISLVKNFCSLKNL